jgi:5-methyltetrahydrofolate--homocysteine methyltransferase
MMAVAKNQVREGSHVIDVCADQTGRDAREDLPPIVKAMATQVPVPLCIDSNSWTTFEPTLKLIGGRALVNSVNLENGEEEFVHYLSLCKSFGAAVICGTIDEDPKAGMAKTAARKVEIAKRMLDIAERKCGMRPWDIFYDPLVLPISTGQEEDRRNALETLEGIRRIKKEVPGTYTAIGLSNVSFGLKPAARHVLNSVFLHHCREAGLDAAIVHAAKILSLFKIDAKERELADDLIFDRRREGYDPLLEFVNAFQDQKAGDARVREEPKTIEEKLKVRIIEGDRVGLEEDLEAAMKSYSPLNIINKFLLDGMKVVGDLFGAGEMQLPFVLQSAETMKAAVAHLEPHMDRVDGETKGRVLLATVRGDVHDIGKNLVDILFTNNGYTVYNLGIKVPITAILEKAREHDVHTIGLSGLLVKSTVVMRENLLEMKRQGVDIPVILGGAALSRRYVEIDCRTGCENRVEYAKDAFEGLALMSSIMLGEPARPTKFKKKEAALSHNSDTGPEAPPQASSARGSSPEVPSRLDRARACVPEDSSLPARADVRRDVDIPRPPFLGSRVVERIALDALLPYVNESVLFKFQWQFKQRAMPKDEYAKFIDREVRPIYLDLIRQAKAEELLQPKAVYGYYECQSEGNDVIVFHPGTQDILHRFQFPRQAKLKRSCIADFFRSVDSGEKDVIAFTVVTVGQKASETERSWFQENRYRDYLYLHGLSVETTEALAEFLHKQIRSELDIGADDDRNVGNLFRQGYRGSRYSFGYPACPNLEDQVPLLKILSAQNIGVALSEEFMLEPEQSTSALIVHHPQAKYFNV